MAATAKALRELLEYAIVPTEEDKGLILRLEVRAYDRGTVLVNGRHMTGQDRRAWTTAILTLAQALDFLESKMEKRSDARYLS